MSNTNPTKSVREIEKEILEVYKKASGVNDKKKTSKNKNPKKNTKKDEIKKPVKEVKTDNATKKQTPKDTLKKDTKKETKKEILKLSPKKDNKVDEKKQDDKVETKLTNNQPTVYDFETQTLKDENIKENTPGEKIEIQSTQENNNQDEVETKTKENKIEDVNENVIENQIENQNQNSIELSDNKDVDNTFLNLEKRLILNNLDLFKKDINNLDIVNVEKRLLGFLYLTKHIDWINGIYKGETINQLFVDIKELNGFDLHTKNDLVNLTSIYFPKNNPAKVEQRNWFTKNKTNMDCLEFFNDFKNIFDEFKNINFVYLDDKQLELLKENQNKNDVNQNEIQTTNDIENTNQNQEINNQIDNQEIKLKEENRIVVNDYLLFKNDVNNLLNNELDKKMLMFLYLTKHIDWNNTIYKGEKLLQIFDDIKLLKENNIVSKQDLITITTTYFPKNNPEKQNQRDWFTKNKTNLSYLEFFNDFKTVFNEFNQLNFVELNDLEINDLKKQLTSNQNQIEDFNLIEEKVDKHKESFFGNLKNKMLGLFKKDKVKEPKEKTINLNKLSIEELAKQELETNNQESVNNNQESINSDTKLNQNDNNSIKDDTNNNIIEEKLENTNNQETQTDNNVESSNTTNVLNAEKQNENTDKEKQDEEVDNEEYINLETFETFKETILLKDTSELQLKVCLFIYLTKHINWTDTNYKAKEINKLFIDIPQLKKCGMSSIKDLATITKNYFPKDDVNKKNQRAWFEFNKTNWSYLEIFETFKMFFNEFFDILVFKEKTDNDKLKELRQEIVNSTLDKKELEKQKQENLDQEALLNKQLLEAKLKQDFSDIILKKVDDIKLKQEDLDKIVGYFK